MHNTLIIISRFISKADVAYLWWSQKYTRSNAKVIWDIEKRFGTVI